MKELLELLLISVLAMAWITFFALSFTNRHKQRFWMGFSAFMGTLVTLYGYAISNLG